jgi:hypothetical protein
MNTLRERWTVAANFHLLAYFRARIARDPRCYGVPASYLAMKNTTREESPNADASPEWIANVYRIVAAKNAWVAEMLDIADNNLGEVPTEIQKQIWDDLIGNADPQGRVPF